MKAFFYRHVQRNVTELQIPDNFDENSVWLKVMKLKDVNRQRKLSWHCSGSKIMACGGGELVD